MFDLMNIIPELSPIQEKPVQLISGEMLLKSNKMKTFLFLRILASVNDNRNIDPLDTLDHQQTLRVYNRQEGCSTPQQE